MFSWAKRIWGFIRSEDSLKPIFHWITSTLVAAFWLTLVLVIWTVYLFLPYRGWVSLFLLARWLLDRENKHKFNDAKRWWKEDDQIINKLLGGNRLNTISGRIGYNAVKWYERKKRYIIAQHIVNKLFWFDPDHCFTSINWLLYPGEQAVLTQKYNQIHNRKRKLP